MKYAEGFVRVTNQDDVITVESDSLYVALTTMAGHLKDSRSFTINAVRMGQDWTLRAAAVPQAAIPAQRQPCGCLTNDTGAHRGDCPDFVTRMDGNGIRYWWRRCCAPWAGPGHSPTCEKGPW